VLLRTKRGAQGHNQRRRFAQKRNFVTRRDESILNLLVESPWWGGGSDICPKLMDEKETALNLQPSPKLLTEKFSQLLEIRLALRKLPSLGKFAGLGGVVSSFLNYFAIN
jgi:hypothetical protein